MKNLLSAWILCLLLTSSAFARDNATRSSIERQYKRWVRSALGNDVEGVLAILTPTYTLKAFDGSIIHRKAYEASLRKRKASGQKPTSYKTSIQSLSVSGSEARVISLETSVKDTPDPITNKIQKLVHIHRYLDTWVRFGNTWRLAATATLVEKTTVLSPR